MNAKQRRKQLRRLCQQAKAIGITLPRWGWKSTALVAGAIEAHRVNDKTDREIFPNP